LCNFPHAVLTDWQVVEVEQLPEDAVRKIMTRDPVTVNPDTPIRSLARQMIDARIHHVVVTDEDKKPMGVVSSTDIVAAVAYSED
jgi:CBS-domain-containing membrane protein